MIIRRVSLIFWGVLAVGALYLCYQMARPFLTPILTAILISVAAYPIHDWLRCRLYSQNIAALISTALVLLFVLVPSTVLAIVLVQQVGALIHHLKAPDGDMLDWLNRPLEWLSKYVDVSGVSLREEILTHLQRASQYLVAGLGKFLGNITIFLFHALIMFITLFFLFRDGRKLRGLLANLPVKHAHRDTVVDNAMTTIKSTIYSGFAIAAMQGALTGIGFWFVGVPGPVVWGFVATLAGLVPWVGAGLVWLPATIWLAVTNEWARALILLAWSGVVVSTVDNFVRPYIVQRVGEMHMHFLLIFFSILGGLEAFGMLGIFLGPMILAVAITLVRAVNDEFREWVKRSQKEEEETNDVSAQRAA